MKKYLDKGELIPSKLLGDFLKERLENTHDNILFVGFPRTVEQFAMLSNLTNALSISERTIWSIQYDNSFETKFVGRKISDDVMTKQLKYFNEIKKQPEFIKWKAMEIDSEKSLFKNLNG